MKLSLLAKSCLCPGLVVLVTNLIKSSSISQEKIDDLHSKNQNWLSDYCEGKKYEIYRVEIPSFLFGQEFCQISNKVYDYSSLILFALEIVVNDRQSGEILLNPGSYKLPRPHSQSMRYTYFGYIIADDGEAANEVFQDKRWQDVIGGAEEEIDRITADY